jgi:hypothetical protein
MENEKIIDLNSSEYPGCSLRKTLIEEVEDINSRKWFKLIGIAIEIAIA